MRRNLFTIAATIVVGLLCVAPAAAQNDSLLFLARRASLDSASARVLSFLEADSTVQAAPATRWQFLLIEDQESELRIVARVVSKVDLHQLGRATGGGHVISGFVQPGIVAPSTIEYYVFRWNKNG